MTHLLSMTKEKHSGECKLCLREAKLCRSHIIPEFCYSACYDGPLHQAILVDPKNARSFTGNQKAQAGRWEYLLCSDCENFLNENYEKEFQEFWYGAKGLPKQVNENILSLECPNVDKFRLFHLSILFRTSIASKFFESVSLGSYYTQELRNVLLSGEAPPQSHYPIVGCVLVDDERNVSHNIVSGAARSLNQNDRTRSYCLLYGGCEWCFCVTDHPTRDDIEIAKAISENGIITLVVSHYAESITGQNIIEQFKKVKSQLK